MSRLLLTGTEHTMKAFYLKKIQRFIFFLFHEWALLPFGIKPKLGPVTGSGLKNVKKCIHLVVAFFTFQASLFTSLDKKAALPSLNFELFRESLAPTQSKFSFDLTFFEWIEIVCLQKNCQCNTFRCGCAIARNRNRALMSSQKFIRFIWVSYLLVSELVLSEKSKILMLYNWL